MRRHLDHAEARHEQADDAERADLREVRDADRQAQAQHAADLFPVRAFPVRERIRQAIGGRYPDPHDHCAQHQPHAAGRRHRTAQRAQLGQAEFAEDEQPVHDDVVQQAGDGDDHDRLGLVDARRIAVQRAVAGERGHAEADDVQERRRAVRDRLVQADMVEHERAQVRRETAGDADAESHPQRFTHRVGDAVEAGGAHLVRDDRVHGHHDAHDGDEDDRPHGRAERHGCELFRADVARHGDVRHAHADGRELAHEHGPRQPPQRGDLGADGMRRAGAGAGQVCHVRFAWGNRAFY